MKNVKAYFWANLNGKAVNVEILHFQLFLKSSEIKYSWRAALAAKAVDEIRCRISHGDPQKWTIARAAWGWATGKVSPVLFKEAFLTVVDSGPSGRKTITTKYRLKNISITGATNTCDEKGARAFEFIVDFVGMEIA